MAKDNPLRWRMRFKLWWLSRSKMIALRSKIEKKIEPKLVALKSLFPFITANLITGARIPIALYGFVCFFQNQLIEALFWYIAGALLDILDGMWARANKETSKFGVILDPVVDKGFVFLFLIGLSYLEYMKAYIVFISAMLEITSTSIHVYAAHKGSVEEGNFSGKAKKWAQDISVVCAFAHMLFGTYFLANHILSFTLVLSLASSWRRWADLKSELASDKKRA